VADEERDRSSLGLPGVQRRLIQAVHAANPRTILVLVTGFPLAIGWEDENLPAILVAWYGGQSQGQAVSDALFGEVNPGGKLTSTWFRSARDLPPIEDYDIRAGRTYLYFEGDPLYPFGHGASYTTFEHTGLSVSPARITSTQTATVRVDVENTGRRAGDEVVQLYVRDVESSVPRPRQQLVGFARVGLAPGQRRALSFDLPPRKLAFWDADTDRWKVEAGAYEISVGSSSRDIRGTVELWVENAGRPGESNAAERSDGVAPRGGGCACLTRRQRVASTMTGSWLALVGAGAGMRRRRRRPH
jgi:beta-glucosidase